MEEPKLQFDEGVKELLLTLLTLGATTYNTSDIEKQIDSRPETPQEKIVATQKAADMHPELPFDKIADNLIKKYNSPVLVKPSKQKKEEMMKHFKVIKPMEKLKPKVTPDPKVSEYADYIRPYEIHGNNMADPSNKKYLKPYKDDKGHWTIGVGYLLGSNSRKNAFVKKHGSAITPQKAEEMFQTKIQGHVDRVKARFGPKWNEFSPELKKTLVDIDFRGDMVNKKKPSEDFEFVKLLKNGEYQKAANAYLDHNEYIKRKNKKDDAVVRRMDRNSTVMSQEAKNDKQG